MLVTIGLLSNKILFSSCKSNADYFILSHADVQRGRQRKRIYNLHDNSLDCFLWS